MTEPVAIPGVTVREQEPLSRHSPWRVGGPCDAWIVIHRREALSEAIDLCRERGWSRTVLGAGTRTVFRDGGLAGAVLRLGQDFLHVVPDETGWWVGAAAPLGWLGATAGEGPLAALRFLGGSVGASVSQDPGWEGWADRVRYVYRGGEQEAAFADVPSRGRVLVTEVHVRRDGEGPTPGRPLPGGWFEPLDDDTPAQLVEECALSATRLRRVCIPRAWPEVLVNLGGGTAKDLQLLQKSAIERVHQTRGVKLQDRMKWAGRHS